MLLDLVECKGLSVTSSYHLCTKKQLNPIQTGPFGSSLDWGGGGASNAPLRFLKTIKDIDMKLTPLIKRREINLLLLSYLSCDVT